MWRGPACPIPHARESVEHRLKKVAQGTSSETRIKIDVTVYRHATEGGLLNGLLTLGVGCSRNHRAPSEPDKPTQIPGLSHLDPKLHQLRRGLREAARPTKQNQMKPSTKDEIKGSFHELKGKVKEKAGQVTNNPNLADEGHAEKIAGKVQKKVGQIEKVLEK